MKKLIALLLALVMCFSLVACGSDKGGDSGNSTNESKTFRGYEFDMDFDFDGPQVIYDKDGVKVTITDVVFEDVRLMVYYEVDDKQGRDFNISHDTLLFINGYTLDVSNEFTTENNRKVFVVNTKDLVVFDIKDIETIIIPTLDLYTQDHDYIRETIDVTLNIDSDYKHQDSINKSKPLYTDDKLSIYLIEGMFGVYNDVYPLLYVENHSSYNTFVYLDNLEMKVNGEWIVHEDFPDGIFEVLANSKMCHNLYGYLTASWTVEDRTGMEAMRFTFRYDYYDDETFEDVISTEVVEVPWEGYNPDPPLWLEDEE